MVYYPLIPTASQDLEVSQPLIQGNFAQANTSFGVDHVAFDVATNNGKHEKVTLVEQSNPTALADEVILFCKEVGGISRLFMMEENSAVNAQQISGKVLTPAGTPPATPYQGSIPLFGGLALKYGKVSGNTTVTFTDAFTTAVYAAFANVDSGSVTVAAVNTVSTTGLNVKLASGSFDAFWIAIGK